MRFFLQPLANQCSLPIRPWKYSTCFSQRLRRSRQFPFHLSPPLAHFQIIIVIYETLAGRDCEFSAHHRHSCAWWLCSTSRCRNAVLFVSVTPSLLCFHFVKTNTHKKKNTANSKVWFCGNVKELAWESLQVNFATSCNTDQSHRKSKKESNMVYDINVFTPRILGELLH